MLPFLLGMFCGALFGLVLWLAERQARIQAMPSLTPLEKALRDRETGELRASLDRLYEIDHARIIPDPHGMP